MEIKIQRRGNVTVFQLEGELREEQRDLLINAIGNALIEHGAKAVLDLERVSYISSAGIAALVQVTARANTLEQRIILTHPSNMIAGVFEATRLNKYFEIGPDIETALRVLSA